jgi:hypothetical protein
MTHFIDRTSSLTKQSFSAAVILHGAKENGSLRIRWTDSQIGWNLEIGAVLHSVEDLNFSHTTKGNTYSNVATLVDHFKPFGIIPLDWNKKPINEGHSAISDCRYLKDGRKIYKVIWAI